MIEFTLLDWLRWAASSACKHFPETVDVHFQKIHLSGKSEKVPTGLNSLKIKVDKLDVHKLISVPVDLSKLSDLVKNYVVKKT